MTHVHIRNSRISESMDIVYMLRENNVEFEFRIIKSISYTYGGAIFSFNNSADAMILILKQDNCYVIGDLEVFVLTQKY